MVAAGVQPFTPAGWWLDSGRGVVITVIALAVLAAAIGVWCMTWPPRSSDVASAAALWTGANVGMAVVLFSTGPGNLFPIVLAMGAGISALAVGAGSLAGALASAATRRPSG